MTIKTLAAALAALSICAAASPRFSLADGMATPEADRVEESGSASPNAMASLSASLVDEKANAQKGSAVVQVKVTGMPDARLQYKVDDGPAMETTDRRVKFGGLKPGAHRIQVLLQGKDSEPLGPSEMLNVTVP